MSGGGAGENQVGERSACMTRHDDIGVENFNGLQ
jgi:hypothetical protein